MDATVRSCRVERPAENLTDGVNGRQSIGGAPERIWSPARPQSTALSPQRDLPRYRRFLSAYYRGDLQSVPIENIIYLQAEHKYVTVRHMGGEILLDESLKSLEAELPDLLLRVHRNALVARSRLSGLSKGPDQRVMVCLRDCPERLPVSRRYLAHLRRLLLRGFEGALNGPDFPLGHSMLAHVTVALPVEIRDRLKRANERTGETVGGIVQRALQRELGRLEQEESACLGSRGSSQGRRG